MVWITSFSSTRTLICFNPSNPYRPSSGWVISFSSTRTLICFNPSHRRQLGTAQSCFSSTRTLICFNPALQWRFQTCWKRVSVLQEHWYALIPRLTSEAGQGKRGCKKPLFFENGLIAQKHTFFANFWTNSSSFARLPKRSTRYCYTQFSSTCLNHLPGRLFAQPFQRSQYLNRLILCADSSVANASDSVEK